MVLHGTIGRFARWGFTHGPAWGTLAAVIGGIPVAALVDANVDGMRIVLIGALAGLLAGPVLGLGRSGGAVGALGIVLLTCVPAIDAARSAPRLLYRAEVQPSTIEVAP